MYIRIVHIYRTIQYIGHLTFLESVAALNFFFSFSFFFLPLWSPGRPGRPFRHEVSDLLFVFALLSTSLFPSCYDY